MELKVSIFDVLTYLLPGLLYFSALVLVSDAILTQDILGHFLSPSVSQAITILIVAYILGHTLQPMYRLSPFVHIFKEKYSEITDEVLENIEGNFDNEVLEKNLSSRAILEKVLVLHDEKLARSSSRFLALAIFMRNLSLPFLLLALAIIPYFSRIGIPLTIFLSMVFISMSLLASYRSSRYRRFSHIAAIEGIVSLQLKSYKFFKVNKP